MRGPATVRRAIAGGVGRRDGVRLNLAHLAATASSHSSWSCSCSRPTGSYLNSSEKHLQFPGVRGSNARLGQAQGGKSPSSATRTTSPRFDGLRRGDLNVGNLVGTGRSSLDFGRRHPATTGHSRTAANRMLACEPDGLRFARCITGNGESISEQELSRPRLTRSVDEACHVLWNGVAVGVTARAVPRYAWT